MSDILIIEHKWKSYQKCYLHTKGGEGEGGEELVRGVEVGGGLELVKGWKYWEGVVVAILRNLSRLSLFSWFLDKRQKTP